MRKYLLSAVVLSGMAVSLTASAAVVSLKAEDDPAAPNFFTLDFGDGQPRDALISDTTYDLRIDADAGTARFVSYDQAIEPIDIPIGPGVFISTGDISVRVVPGSSSGSYAAGTGAFTTTEQYEISFTGDLSAIGFLSPVVLPSSSSGTVIYTGAQSGTIEQLWDGETFVGPVLLHYQCRVSSTFSQRFPGDLNCDNGVAVSDIDSFVQALVDPKGYSAAHPTCDAALADINGDGYVTVGDISAFVNLLTT